MADDIALASGTVVSGSFGIQPNDLPGAHFVETFVPTPGDEQDFSSPLGAHVQIEEFLFNTMPSSDMPGSRTSGTLPNGDTYVLVNGGFGTEDLLVPEPPSVLVLSGGLLFLGLLRARNIRRSK
jgi:hypothetical protein